MARALHEAIQDALAGPGYQDQAILASHVLEATHPIDTDEATLYRCVHAFFSSLPRRLIPGSVFLVTTTDVDDGIELAWEAREVPKDDYRPGEGIYGAYDHDEPLARALRDLERYCDLRAGYVRTTYEKVQNSSSFRRPDHIHRRVVAKLPLSPVLASLRAQEAHARPGLPHASVVAVPPEGSAPREAPRVPASDARRRVCAPRVERRASRRA